MGKEEDGVSFLGERGGREKGKVFFWRRRGWGGGEGGKVRFPCCISVVFVRENPN